MKLLLIDNYDSFVFNLYQYFLELNCQVTVIRNDKISVKEIQRQNFGAIVISPGPGHPSNEKDFGVCSTVILQCGKKTPILGVCLGHQGIASVFGGTIIRSAKPMHGKVSVIRHNGKGIFSQVKNPLRVMRYHSLVCEKKSLPECIEVCAQSIDDKAVMALKHKEFPIFGVQFHPESIMTEEGKKILKNFCEIAGGKT